LGATPFINVVLAPESIAESTILEKKALERSQSTAVRGWRNVKNVRRGPPHHATFRIALSSSFCGHPVGAKCQRISSTGASDVGPGTNDAIPEQPKMNGTYMRPSIGFNDR
jgi:hypothetical protein